MASYLERIIATRPPSLCRKFSLRTSPILDPYVSKPLARFVMRSRRGLGRTSSHRSRPPSTPTAGTLLIRSQPPRSRLHFRRFCKGVSWAIRRRVVGKAGSRDGVAIARGDEWVSVVSRVSCRHQTAQHQTIAVELQVADRAIRHAIGPGALPNKLTLPSSCRTWQPAPAAFRLLTAVPRRARPPSKNARRTCEL